MSKTQYGREIYKNKRFLDKRSCDDSIVRIKFCGFYSGLYQRITNNQIQLDSYPDNPFHPDNK